LARELTTRFSYAKIPDACEMPNLLDVQLESYNDFLQAGVTPDKLQNVGLHKIFKEIFPVTDVHENYSLEYINYYLGPRRYTIEECRERNMTFAAPLKVTMRLISRQGEGEQKEV
jgi:DNA-directed RNA polymerase subunit beta